MLDKANTIGVLIKKHMKGEISVAEQKQLDEFINQSPAIAKLFGELNSEADIDSTLRLYAEFENRWEQFDQTRAVPVVALVPKRKQNIYYYAAASVAALIIITATVYYFLGPSSPSPDQPAVTSQQGQPDAQPGSRRAVLTLANQSTIDLEDAQAGVIAQEGSTTIQKNTDGSLLYQGSGSTLHEGMNTLSTPRGGYYFITLSDGSRVWVNAASVLRYPPSFRGKERRVHLSGEAYFEIAKKPEPFLVETDNETTIRVTGTHFNVNSYPDEPVEKTSLLEGSVIVSSKDREQKLSPGHAATYAKKDKRLTVGEANVQAAVYWTKGYFSFSRANLQEIMRQLSRWYAVEVVYGPGLGNELQIQGSFSRNIPLSEVLAILKKFNDTIEYTLENNKVLVYRKNE